MTQISSNKNKKQKKSIAKLWFSTFSMNGILRISMDTIWTAWKKLRKYVTVSQAVQFNLNLSKCDKHLNVSCFSQKLALKCCSSALSGGEVINNIIIGQALSYFMIYAHDCQTTQTYL